MIRESVEIDGNTVSAENVRQGWKKTSLARKKPADSVSSYKRRDSSSDFNTQLNIHQLIFLYIWCT